VTRLLAGSISRAGPPTQFSAVPAPSSGRTPGLDRRPAGKQLLAGLNEIDSDATMEYGLILPHPDGETEWFSVNADGLDGIWGTG